MADPLQELKKELEKSVHRQEDRLASLSLSKSPSVEERKAKKRVASQIKKTNKQLQELTLLLNGERPQTKPFTADIDGADVHSPTTAFSTDSNMCDIHSLTNLTPDGRPIETKDSACSSNSCCEGRGLDDQKSNNDNHDGGIVKEGNSKVSSEERDGNIRSIVILMAMEQEAKPFLERHQLVENNPSPFESGSPMLSYSGKVSTISGGKVHVHLIWNGRCKIHSCNLVATTAAAVATYAAVQVFRPDLVISAGTAGGFGELGAGIGDVYLSTKCIFHARRIPICLPSQKDAHCFKDKYFEEYGFGHFRSPPLSALARRIGVKQGIVSSSDCLDCSEIDLQLLRSEGAVVKEMEAAAVAWVCQVLGRPFFALKSITDIVDGSLDSEEEFYANLALASGSLQEKLTLVVTHLGGTTLPAAATGTAASTSPPCSSLPQSSGSVSEEERGAVGAASLSGDTEPIPCGLQPGKKESQLAFNHQDDSVGARRGASTSTSYTFSVPKGFLHGLSCALLVGACSSLGMLVYSKSKTK